MGNTSQVLSYTIYSIIDNKMLRYVSQSFICVNFRRHILHIFLLLCYVTDGDTTLHVVSSSDLLKLPKLIRFRAQLLWTIILSQL